MTKLIDLCRNSITMTADMSDKLWVYGVYDSKEQLVFMFYGKLKDIVALRPFRINPKFDEKEKYTYVLIQPCKDKIEAENTLATVLIRSELNGNTPPYNVYNKLYNDRYFIHCLNNGKFYKSAQDVIKIFHISQPALSNHLRGVTGYRHVKGLTFRFYNDENAQSPNEVELAGGWKWVKSGEMGGYLTVRSDDIINREGITENEISIGINHIITEGYLRGVVC